MTRFSERLLWSTPRNQYSLLLEEKRRSGVRPLDLTVSNPTEAFANYPHQAIAQAYGAVSSFRYEPEAFGSGGARRAIADWYAAQQIPAESEQIALTASTSEAYSLLFKLLCDPGDEVLIPSPSYPLFEYLARLDSVKTVPYHLSYDGSWFVDFDSLERAISGRTKGIVLVSPNNPTGSYLKLAELNRLTDLAAKHGLVLISDEVFMTYPAVPPLPTQVRSLIGHDKVLSFSLNGLSKAAGMPQMKLGWIAVNGPASERAAALAKLELLLDSYLSVGTPVQSALPELLRIGSTIAEQIGSRLQQNRQTLTNLLADAPVEALGSEGGWSAILQIPRILTEDEWIAKLLANETIVVQPGYFYDMAKEAYLVVSLITEPADLAAGIERLKQLVRQL